MKNRVGRVLAVALIAGAASLSSGCGLLPKYYKMQIRPTGNVASQLQSLYVIVSPKEVVAEPLLSASKYGELLQEDRIRRYTSFVQYQPEGGTWKQVYAAQNPNEYITYKVDDENIKLKINHKLISKSGMSEFNVVVLAFFGSGGFEQVTADHLALDSNKDQTVQVSGGSLSLLDN